MNLFRRLPSFALIGAVWAGAQATAQTFDGPAQVYRTAYTWHDNTPPGSAVIARSVVHDRAGGVGTWEDPITVAVGHSATGSVHTWDVPAGTRLYFPDLARYGVVEDLCGDGDRPQDGPATPDSKATSGWTSGSTAVPCRRLMPTPARRA